MQQQLLVSNFSLFIVYLDNFSGGSKAIETIKVLSRIVWLLHYQLRCAHLQLLAQTRPNIPQY